MNVRIAGAIEPKPGIPPTASHIINLSRKAKAEKISVILVEDYFSTAPALRIKRDNPAIRVEKIAVAVGGRSELKTLADVYRHLATSIAPSVKPTQP